MNTPANVSSARPSPEDIAGFVKVARAHFDWKQLALAHEAGVNVRTIERIESGDGRTSAETLAKIAKALKLPEGFFIEPGYWPSAEELEARARKAKEIYTTTQLHPVARPLDLENVLNAIAYLIDGDAVEEGLADDVASLKDQIQDWGDIYSDLPNSSRLQCCRDLLATIRDIEAHGYTAQWGCYATDEKFKTGILSFQKTAGLPSDHHFRVAIVPRSIIGNIA